MSEIGIKDQCFGVEVEMTGITREQAAHALADYFGTSPQYLGTGYDTWGVTDPEGPKSTVPAAYMSMWMLPTITAKA